MLRVTLLSISLSLLPVMAQAVPVFNVTSSFCSGIQITNLNSPLSLNCTGDLTITGGTISDSTAVSLTASGALTLTNIILSAPSIQLTAGAAITVGTGSVLTATNSIIVNSNTAGIVTPIYASTPAGSLSIGSGTVFTPTTGNVAIQNNALLPLTGGIPLTGGVLTITSPVPETSTYLTLLLGLLTLFGLRRTTRSQTQFVL